MSDIEVDVEQEPGPSGRTKRKRRAPQKYEVEQGCSSEWSIKEKKDLLDGVKKFGIYDYENLQTLLPDKNLIQIKAFLASKLNIAREVSKFKAKQVHATIDQWLEVLMKAKPRCVREVNTLPIANGLLAISKFEKHPDPNLCGGVDFKELYEYLYCMSTTRPAKALSPASARFLLKSLEQLREVITLKDNEPEKQFLASVNRVQYKGISRQYSGKKSEQRTLLDEATTEEAVPKNLVPDEGTTTVPLVNKSRLQGPHNDVTVSNVLALPGFNPLAVPIDMLLVPKDVLEETDST